MSPKLIIALRDRKAELFLQPVFTLTVGVFYRSIQDEISRGGDGNMIASHPEDFDVYQLGVYDEESGDITVGDGLPVLLCSVSMLLLTKS